MHVPLLPTDASLLPVRERCWIGTGVVLLHLLFAVLLLRVIGHGVQGTGGQTQGEGLALSATFVTFTPITHSEPVSPVSMPPVLPNLEKGSDARTTQTSTSTPETVPVLSEMGDPSSSEASQMALHATRQIAAANTASSAKGGDPGDNPLASYHAALRAAIRRKWAILTDRPFPSDCSLRLNLAMGGSVTATSANGCVLSNEDRLQLEAAALMAQPLPYAGYEVVFSADLTLEL